MGKKRCIIGISSDQVTPAFRALFDSADPACSPCFAVLDGSAQGKIFTDSPASPTWGAILDCTTGRLHLGGEIHYPCLRRLVGRLRRTGKIELVTSKAVPAGAPFAVQRRVDVLDK